MTEVSTTQSLPITVLLLEALYRTPRRACAGVDLLHLMTQT